MEQLQASEPFLAAFDAIERGDTPALQSFLLEHPALARERGANGNTLLNLAVSVAAKGDPELAVARVEPLLAAGADVNAPNDHAWTPLHQAAYTNHPALAEALLAHGADPTLEAHGSGGTPLVVALFWGHREAATLLSRYSVVPRNLRTVAGLGDEALLNACFQNDSELTAEAGAARGFYRPHSGFPEWQPSSDPQEILDEAIVWASKSGTTNVLPRLVRAGGRLDADPYRGTALIWAAVCNRLDTAEWLMAHGAPVNQKATFGGPTHGQGVTALHMAAQYGNLDMVRLLIAHGADPGIRDDLHNGDAEGAAAYFKQDAVVNYLRSLRGH